jgi:hypothetical protein
MFPDIRQKALDDLVAAIRKVKGRGVAMHRPAITDSLPARPKCRRGLAIAEVIERFCARCGDITLDAERI